MKMLRKTLAILLTVLMTVTSLPMTAGLISSAAEDNEPFFVADEVELTPMVPEGFYFTGKTNVDDKGNEIYHINSIHSQDSLAIGKWIYFDGEPAQDPDILPAYPKTEYEGEPVVKDDNDLPAAYDSRDYGYITPVEDQVGGTCWAHAAIACIETAYIKQGFGDTLDLSEYHTVWYSKNGYIDGVTDSLNDGYKIAELNNILDEGGYTGEVSSTMMNFIGGALESRFPMKSTGSSAMLEEMQTTFTFENKYVNDVVLDSIKTVRYDINTVKQAVMDYGAAFISYYSDTFYYCRSGAGKPLAYYYPEAIGTNHAVTVVGWDDNFSKDNFGTYKPENDGAWLIKNSWGTNWGDDGYFWMSYEDKTIYSSLAVFTLDDINDYEEVYMYDGFGYRVAKYSGVKAAANVFTAEDDIYLTKVSYGSKTNRDYTLKIYTGLAENCTDPTAGTLLYTQSGNTKSEKYINLEGDVRLSKGERFSVVLEMTYLYFEGSDYTPSHQHETYKYTSNPGESFYMDSSDTWVDTNSNGWNNSCIRAIAKYQDDAAPYKITYSDKGYHSETYVSEDGSVKLPELAGHTYVLTYNSQPFTATVVDRDITVNMHCYPTEGIVNSEKECVTEFNCIYCGKEMLPDIVVHEYEPTVKEGEPCTTYYDCMYCGTQVLEPVTDHKYKAVVTPATEAEIGYTTQICSVCDDSYFDGYAIYEGAVGGEENSMWWQYVNGNLTVRCKGATPDFTTSDTLPWSEYAQSITTVNVNEDVTRIGNYLFSNLSNVTQVNLPETLTVIGQYCFSEAAALETFICPANLTEIQNYAFNNAASLKDITYNAKIKKLGGYAFNGCSSLVEAVIPGSVTSVGTYLYYNCSSLKKITVEEGVTFIPYLVWNNSVLEEIIIPSTLKNGYFMNYAHLNKYTVSEENKYYCSVDGVLFNKQMTNLIAYPATKADIYYSIPATVKDIDMYCFSFLSGLKYLDMSACSENMILNKVFNQCHSLRYVNLPSTLTEIHENGFFRTRISKIYVPATVTTVEENGFNRNDSAYYVIPSFYTDSEESAIKAFADAGTYECTVIHTAHSFVNEMSDMKKDPDCKNSGSSLKTCECGSFEYTFLEATGEHTPSSAVTTDPTCEEKGYTTYICSVCGSEYKDDYKDELGHDFEWITDKEATCSESGIKHEKCKVCDALRSENTIIPATESHKYTKATVCEEALFSAADCSTPASYYYSCSDCGKIENNADHIFTDGKALGHSYEWITDEEPTCSKEGVKHEECSVCHEKTKENTKIDKLSHTESEWITDEEATCKEEGSKHTECTVCGETIKTEAIPTVAHTYTSKVTEPTCTEGGYTTYTCDCGESYKADETAKLGHSLGEWTQTKAPTCKEKGEEKADCSKCDYFETKEIPTVAHSYTSKVTEPTCTEGGYTTYTCECGDSYKADETAKLGHSLGEWTQTKAPTCKEKGEEKADCSKCDYFETKEIPTVAHSYTSKVTEPTCTEGGYTTYTCDCGESYKADETAKLGHSLGEWTQTKAPTCKEKGEKTAYCSKCDYFEIKEIPTIAHSYTSKVTEPTCTEGGYTTYTCECGDSYKADETTKLGHSLGEWTQTKAPTCKEKGEKTAYCSKCDYFETKEIPTIAHSYTSKVTAPTCTEGGYTTYTCDCGESYKADETAKLGHSLGEWTQTKAPTCTEKGEKKADCSKCDYFEIKEIPTVAHTYTSKVTAPTCTEKGYTIYSCAVCNHSYKADYVSAPGHKDGNGDGMCDSCSENIKTESCSCMCHKSGFMGFIYKIIRIFWKLFKTNQSCGCGFKHY